MCNICSCIYTAIPRGVGCVLCRVHLTLLPISVVNNKNISVTSTISNTTTISHPHTLTEKESLWCINLYLYIYGQHPTNVMTNMNYSV